MDILLLIILVVIGVFKPKAGKYAFELDTLNQFLGSQAKSSSKSEEPLTPNQGFEKQTSNPTPPTQFSQSDEAPKLNDVLNTTFDANAFNEFSKGGK